MSASRQLNSEGPDPNYGQSDSIAVNLVSKDPFKVAKGKLYASKRACSKHLIL